MKVLTEEIMKALKELQANSIKVRQELSSFYAALDEEEKKLPSATAVAQVVAHLRMSELKAYEAGTANGDVM